MPIYTYRFEDGTEVDIQQSIDSEALDVLLHPNGVEGWLPVKRVYSAPGIVLKGRGFYRTGG